MINLNNIRLWIAGKMIAAATNHYTVVAEKARKSADAKQSAIEALANARYRDIDCATCAEEVGNAVFDAVKDKKVVAQ